MIYLNLMVPSFQSFNLMINVRHFFVWAPPLFLKVQPRLSSRVINLFIE